MADFLSFDRSRLLTDAESGKTVEMIVAIFLTDLQKGEPLVFEIERGHVGSTQAELMSYVGGKPVVVATLAWGGIAPGERNARQF